MQLGTSTNLLCFRPDGSKADLTKTLQLVSEAGFKVFDLNFYDWSLPGSLFLTDRWEAWIDQAAECAAKLGVRFGQCHGYFYPFLDPLMSEEEKAHHHMLQQRSLLCCRKIGAHTCVLHPETAAGMDGVKKSFRGNREYFKPLVEQMEAWDMRLAIENMCDYSIAPRRKFGACPEELVELVNSFQSRRIGICWDFEHGDIMEINQKEALLYIGPLLYATHVSDTYSKTDNTLMHVLPMTGTVNWEEVMDTLAKIRYQGDFCFEVHNFINRLPDAVVPTALRLAYEIGEYLLSCSRREK